MITHDHNRLEFLEIQKYITLIFFVHELADIFNFLVVSYNRQLFASEATAGGDATTQA